MTWSTLHRTYLLASRAAGPLARPILRKRLARGKEDAERLGERLGRALYDRPEGTLIWIHGASVGEAMSMLPLIDALLAARDDVRVLVTTGTVTSAQRIAGLLPKRARHQFVPVDTQSAVKGFLDHWRPDLAIWVESELWPRLVTETARRRIPMALVNARFSEKTMRAWRYAPEMLRSMLEMFRLIRTQDADTTVRLRKFRIASRFMGNLKALIETPTCDPDALQAAQPMLADRLAWLAASTHADDEAEILRAQQILKDRAEIRPLLILAPRHPERGDALGEMLRASGLTVATRSRDEWPTPDTDVWLADTLGEMGLWYRLAQVTFVGGSFGQAGGHTPFEPMLLDSAVIHGPNVANFAPAYAVLAARSGAKQVADGAELAEAVERLLLDTRAFERTIEAARVAHSELMPDLPALTEELLDLMEPAR